MRARLDAALRFATVLSLGALIGAVLLWRHQFGPVYLSGPATVIDGDSIRVAGRTIRLIGIDAPELPVRDDRKCRRLLSRPECFERAAIALHWLIGGEKVRCWIVGSGAMTAHGKWGRPLGVCFHGQTELNAWMLHNCHADLPEKRGYHVWRYQAVAAERVCPHESAPLARLDAE